MAEDATLSPSVLGDDKLLLLHLSTERRHAARAMSGVGTPRTS